MGDFLNRWVESAGTFGEAVLSSPAWYVPAALTLTVAVGALWLVNAVMLPGNWAIAVAAAGWAWLMPADEWGRGFGWGTVVVLFVLAGLGELLEAVAGVAGAAGKGGSRRAAVLSMAGAAVGGLFGATAGVPLPLIGPLVGAVMLGAAGAFAGAFFGELWKGRASTDGFAVGTGAFWGKLLGTLGRLACGAVMVAIVAIFVWLPVEPIPDAPTELPADAVSVPTP
ncbi:MAG: DUF456 domain-containing protein [Planctomycetota bacterium]